MLHKVHICYNKEVNISLSTYNMLKDKQKKFYSGVIQNKEELKPKASFIAIFPLFSTKCYEFGIISIYLLFRPRISRAGTDEVHIRPPGPQPLEDLAQRRLALESVQHFICSH